VAASTLYAEILAENPWLAQFNLTPQRVQQLVATAVNDDDLLTKIRNEPTVRARFVGLYRQDGSLRMNEGQYLQRENEYRTLLRQAGVNVDIEYASPQSLLGFFEGEKSPDELRDQLQIWQAVQQSGPRVRETFYTYAGLNPTDDDLFEAVVDGAKEQQLYNTYNAKVAGEASGPAAWQNWITRATDVGLSRVAKILTDAQTYGATKGSVVQRVLSVDPQFARQIMDVIYTGGDATPGRAGSLSLPELLDSFEFMAVGAAASEAGLELPTRQRLAEIRAAGVDKAKMLSGYTAFGQNKQQLAAAVARARGATFGQTEFEQAQFLGNAGQASNLLAGQNYIEAAGRDAGTFRFGERNGRLVQSGFRNY
jgi:hypothetical protein